MVSNHRGRHTVLVGRGYQRGGRMAGLDGYTSGTNSGTIIAVVSVAA